MVDGIDLSGRVIGDIIELPVEQADILVAEGWAEPASQLPEVASPAAGVSLAMAAEAPRRRRRFRR